MDNNSCLARDSVFSEDNSPPIFESYSDQCINNENFNYDNECQPGQIDSTSVSSSGSASNLKIDAPEFIPFQKLKCEDLKDDKKMDLLGNDSKNTVILNDNKFNAEFKNEVLLSLQYITRKITTEFSKLNQKQGDLLFKSEDRVNFLQKMFLDEINKEKQKFEEEKIKNVQLEAKIESLSEILAKTTKEKEEQIKQNVLMKSCLEKQLHVMNDFQKNLLTEFQKKCCYMKMKLQQVTPYITYSVPWYEDFQANVQQWRSYEILLAKHLAAAENNLKLLKIVDYSKLDNLPADSDFPVTEPKSILNDVFLHVLHSYNYLYQNSSTPRSYHPNHVPPPYNNYMYQQQSGVPIYYASAQSSGSNIQNNSGYHPNPQHQQNEIAANNISLPQQTFNSEITKIKDGTCLSERKTPLTNPIENVNNPKEHNEPILSLEYDSNSNTSQPLNKCSIDSVIPDQALPSPLSPNISKSKNMEPLCSPTSYNKQSTMVTKGSLLPLDDCLGTDRATQGTSEAHFEDLECISPETERRKDKNEVKFYDASLDIEEQIDNLSSKVKAAGGMKFLHLFVYLWQNIPYVTEETLLEALLSVKKTVGKFTGMKKESILISVKRILEPETESSGILNNLTEMCTVCYENFSGSKTLRLKCGHTFHYSCGRKWLVNNNVCPICRFCVLSEDDLQ